LTGRHGYAGRRHAAADGRSQFRGEHGLLDALMGRRSVGILEALQADEELTL
jgi:hypothetical protein